MSNTRKFGFALGTAVAASLIALPAAQAFQMQDLSAAKASAAPARKKARKRARKASAVRASAAARPDRLVLTPSAGARRCSGAPLASYLRHR
ncbi:MAG: hypothetical protein MUE46_04975 [Xanthomonadales bacterium]|nr:hypothetical protein [Xanthomonadales bacterium]